MVMSTPTFTTPEPLCDGFAFIEGPRWHQDALWFSDMHGEAVYRVGLDRAVHHVVDVPLRPSGLGWLPNGDLLVASMLDRCVYRLQNGTDLLPYADLSGVAEQRINDMLVDPQGRAWVGNFGFNLPADEPPAPGTLARVDPDGSAHPAAGDLLFANGMALLDHGQVLVVAETFRGCLTAFDIGADGELGNRRCWAQLPEGSVPDGICATAEGMIWVASPTCGRVLCLAEGGRVLAEIATGRQAIACAMGGENGEWLFVSSAVDTARDACLGARSARVDIYTGLP
jgi:sugar lactone lactonase YvrE